MAKKTKSYSQVGATDALEQLGQRGASAMEFMYDLLRIFAGYGDSQIRRTKEGPGNLAKDGETVLIKNLVAYLPVTVNTINDDCALLYEIVNAMREDPRIIKQSPRLYIVSNLVPRVSSEKRQYIPIGFVNSNTIASDSTQVVYDADLLTFAILANRMHTIWLSTVGGKLETRYRYSNLVYDSFPFPKLTTDEKEELEQLAQNILNIRDENFDMTLGEMYNPETMPEELREAHHQLDLAVERIYRSEPFTSDEERLEHLFKLYAKMTKK